jgi:hypothetical protein
VLFAFSSLDHFFCSVPGLQKIKIAMQIAFDDGGFALDDVEKPSLNMNIDADDDAWDDTEILQIFDAAVRSHVTKGQSSKCKKGKEKENSSILKEVDVYALNAVSNLSNTSIKYFPLCVVCVCVFTLLICD